MYEDLAVPVYTTIKGRATQIRSTPFTEDSSSDSSDNEEGGNQDYDSTPTSVAGPSGVKSTSVKKQVGQTSSGAMKRGVSSHSITSETSSDYAVPPDDELSIQSESSGDSEPEQKLLKYTNTCSKSGLERCGILTKLGGKMKNWKKRFFVLKNGELLYYKSASEVSGKPQGHIALDGHTKIRKADGNLTFEISTSIKSFYLIADTSGDMDQWIRVIQNVLKKQAADKGGSSRSREISKGWLLKGHNGRIRRCYCVLLGKVFNYYKSPNDKVPLGQIPLRNARVEEVDRSCDSDSDSECDSNMPDYTIAVWPMSQGPTYLMIPTKHEKDSWLYHLTVATGGSTGNVGTDYEQLVSKLMEVDGDPNCMFWKHPTLLHTREPIVKPLTTLPSEDLQMKAVQLFKLCSHFMCSPIKSQQIEGHIVLAQNILETCLEHAEIQNELYCQLIRQTSKHPPQQKSGMQMLLCGSHSCFLCDASPTSPIGGTMDPTDSKFNTNTYVFEQCWQLMAMAISLFLPKQTVLWYLKAHLQRNADTRTEIGKYAIFCQRTLERTAHNGGREAKPSRMEALSILLRNPYHLSQPISVPVHFLNHTYQVVSFDGSTTVEEFLATLHKAIGMRKESTSGFALFTDDPAGQELEHCLKTNLKLCDVISKWEQAYMHHVPNRRQSDTTRTVRLTYKNRLYCKSCVGGETEKERLLLAYQINEEVVNGRFPLNKDLAVELCSLMAQIEFGDFRTLQEVSPAHSKRNSERFVTSTALLPSVIDKFYPKRYRDIHNVHMRLLEEQISQNWLSMKGKTTADCIRIYLNVTRKWQFFGAKLFSAKVRSGDPLTGRVWLAVQEDGVSILEYETLKVLSTFNYKMVVTFGGWQEDLMIVVSHRVQDGPNKWHTRTDRHIYIMKKPKMLEITMLMASYINLKNHQSPQRSVTMTTNSSTIDSNLSHTAQPPSPTRPPPLQRSPRQQYPASQIPRPYYGRPTMSGSMEV